MKEFETNQPANERYKKVIKYSQLTEDLLLLPQSDLTQIGSNGINLSGG